jgi:voltage-gated potassium channel Kch
LAARRESTGLPGAGDPLDRSGDKVFRRGWDWLAGGLIGVGGIDSSERAGRGGEWLAVTAIASIAVALGYEGFARLPQSAELSSTELLYRSLQLFVLESGAVQPPGPGQPWPGVPWQLEVARVLAPVTTAYAAVRALVALFREHLRISALRFLDEHVVVAGLGTKGFQLARSLREAGARVVAIEQAEGAVAIEGCRQRGIPVLRGDAADDRVLGRTRLHRARHLVVCCGDDGVNTDVAFAARRLAADRSGDPLLAFVAIDNTDLWQLAKAHGLARHGDTTIRLEPFSVVETAARLLLEQFPPLPPADEGAQPPHVLVVGSGSMAKSLVLRIAGVYQRTQRQGDKIALITLADPGASSVTGQLLDRHPDLNRACRLIPKNADVAAGDLARSDQLDPVVTTAYVCLDNDAEALAAGLALLALSELRDARIVLTVESGSGGVAAAVRGQRAGVAPLATFGRLDSALTPQLLLRGTTEVLARAKHEQYIRDEHRRGVDSSANEAAVPWDELPENLKRSNRLFADSVWTKLEAAGCLLVPAPLADPDFVSLPLTDAEVEEMAIAEHDRWSHDMIKDGWRLTQGPKNSAEKHHPDLIPWEALSEEARDKDREAITGLPGILASAGFEMVRNGANPVLSST